MTKSLKKELITVAILFAVNIAVSIIPAKGIIDLLLHLTVYFVAGFPVFNRLIRSLSKKKVFTDRMMITAASVLAVAAGHYAEAVTVILLYRLCQAFCDYVKLEAEKSIGKDCNSDRNNIERFIARLSRLLTPIVIAVALFVLAIAIIVSPSSWRDGIIKGAIIIAIAYPSAIAISVPFAFFTGIGIVRKNGVTIKSSYSIERLSKCSTVVFDKSGTLTEEVCEVYASAPQVINEDQLLIIAKAVLSGSDSACAIALRRIATDSAADIAISNVRDVEGLGTIASMADKIIAIGNAELMSRLGIATEMPVSDMGHLLHVCLGQTYLGYISISGTVRKGIEDSLCSLKDVGVKSIVMLTEDGISDATRVADTIHGIDEFHHSLNGEGMAKVIEEIFAESAENETLAFVTSSTENASVLASADISIALNGIDSEDTDIVILDNSLDKIPTAISIASSVMLNVKINLWASLGIKLIVALLGTIGLIGLGTAVFIDLVAVCLALVNSVRLLFEKKEDTYNLDD